MDMDFMCIMMDKDMKDNCSKAWKKDKESTFTKMEGFIKDNGLMIKGKVKELKKTKLRAYTMKVIGQMIKSKEMAEYICSIEWFLILNNQQYYLKEFGHVISLLKESSIHKFIRDNLKIKP